MIDVRHENAEFGHKDPVGPDGVEGTPGKVADILSQGADWTPAAGFDKGLLQNPSDAFDEQNFFDNLEIDEDALEAKRDGGGEAFEPSSTCEGGGCII